MKRISKYDKIKVNFLPELAEIIGIVLGDGGLYQYHKNKYTSVVVFNKDEINYLSYVKKLLKGYFAPYTFSFYEDKSEHKLFNNSIYVGKILIGAGIRVGNKIKNDIIIPD